MLLGTLIKKSFETIIKNPAITLFFVLFLIITNFLTSAVFMAKTMPAALVLLVCMICIATAFMSGWFQVLKEATEEKKEKNFYSIFLEGAGKNVLTVFVAMILYIVLFLSVIFIAKFIAFKIFGSLDFLMGDISVITQDQNAAIEYLNKLPIDKQSAVYGSYFSLLCAMGIFNFLMLFYFPVIFFTESKNFFLRAFVAFKNSIVFTFKNFFGVLLLSILIHVTYFILTVLSAVFARNILFSLIFLFIYIYFVTGAIMVIFNYYAKKNNSDNGTDCIGEN